jgi:predicted NACHT family NTPase
MLTDYLIERALDTSLDIAKKLLKKSSGAFTTTREDLEQAIQHHVTFVKNWSKEVDFSDSQKARSTLDIYVDVDLYLYPKRVRIDTSEIIKSIPLKTIFQQDVSHIVILGHPGAGKTTSAKFLCQSLIYGDDSIPQDFTFPIVIRCRDLNMVDEQSADSILIDHIFNLLGLNVQLPPNLADPKTKSDEKQRHSLRERLVLAVLDQLSVVLFIEGFDEIINPVVREGALHQLRSFASRLERCLMIVTSRTGEFAYKLENTVEYEIVPLTTEQIFHFACKWLGNTDAASEFCKRVQSSPFADTMIRPLTLAHLCAIYERVGKIPDKPRTIYRKVVNLLLEEWDQQRSVHRRSKYGNFEVDRKFEFLSHLAFYLTTKSHQTVFTDANLEKAYEQIFENFGLALSESKDVVRELESHTGLFLETGYKQYEFAHKSLQEYLTAEYFVKLPQVPKHGEVIGLIPDELAIAITLSSNQNDYFYDLVVKRFNATFTPRFYQSFIGRLLIEKPDFNLNIPTGLALLSLYNLSIESMMIAREPMTILPDYEQS